MIALRNYRDVPDHRSSAFIFCMTAMAFVPLLLLAFGDFL